MDAVTALDVCDRSVYPVTHRLLQILAVQPVFTISEIEVFRVDEG